MDNLDLSINNEQWKVEVSHTKENSYWMADSQHKTLKICNMPVDSTKEQCYRMYKKEC